MAMDLIITHHTRPIKTDQFTLMAASQTVRASIDILLLILGIDYSELKENVSYFIFYLR